jgi:hypothetical protein
MNESLMGSRLWVVTFFMAVASDATSGALRYYASFVGAEQVVYLPKVLMLVCIALMVAQRPKVWHLLAGLYMAVQACVALANGVDLEAVGFWMWLVSPMLFAMLAPPEAVRILNGSAARTAFMGLAILCMVGVLVNYEGSLPWTGKSMAVGGFDVAIAQPMWVGSTPRLAGFGRSSAATGLLIGLLTTWLLPRLRSATLKAVLLVAAALAIWGTTNKTTVIGLVLVVALNHFAGSLTLRKACFWALAVTIALPLGSFVVAAGLNYVGIDSEALSSLQDRIVNTWPLLLQGMLREQLIWFGIGPGGFGSPAVIYPGDFGFNVAYADNVALYTVANFGVVGAVVFTLLLMRVISSSESENRALWIMFFFLLISGVTTDISESLGCLLFLGITIRCLWRVDAPMLRPYSTHSRANGPSSHLGHNTPSAENRSNAIGVVINKTYEP